MPIAVRHRHDVLPPWSPLPGFSVRREDDPGFMASLQGRPEAEMRRRMDEGHRAYVASREGAPAAWGWVATRSATIGEVGSSFAIPAGERYLWNFVTLAAHRGQGLYPRLLDAIVGIEAVEAERFWIAYAPENHASGAGIRKAGFRLVAELSFDDAGRPAVRAGSGGDGAAVASALGLPEARAALAPCWRCARAGRLHFCAPGTCTCDYQRPDEDCAA